MDILLIFCMQVVYVTITTVRWIILMKGSYKIAASISFFEIVIWVSALSLVVTRLQDPLRILVYAAGYSVGAILGGKLEEKLAYGYSVLQVITERTTGLPQLLRQEGFGVTNWSGSGLEGEREVLMVLARRKQLGDLTDLINRHDPHAFILVSEPRAFKGGFLARYGPLHHPFRAE
jgi:uncharacterized protein YebE (UPF0316 family)